MSQSVQLSRLLRRVLRAGKSRRGRLGGFCGADVGFGVEKLEKFCGLMKICN